jgi:tetratricopeptide (TPR) repeat protein
MSANRRYRRHGTHRHVRDTQRSGNVGVRLAVPCATARTPKRAGQALPLLCRNMQPVTRISASLAFTLLLFAAVPPGLRAFQVSVRAEPGAIVSSGPAIPASQIVEAVTKARREIAQNPRSAQGYLLLGTALRAGGNLQAAARALDQAAQFDPNLSAVWLQKGLIALQNGTIASAENLFQKAVDADPANSPARLELAAVLLRQGDFKKAESQLEAALRSDAQNAGVWDGLGFISLEEGDPGAAAGDFRKALALKSPYPEAEENLGEALLQRGDAAGARAAFEKALAEGLPDASMATYGLASALKRLNENALADAEFVKARELMRQMVLTSRAQNENDRGLQLWYSGDLSGAAAAFRQAIASDPSYAEAHNNLGGVLWQMKDVAGAQREFAAAVRDKPDFGKARNNLGNVLLNAGNVEEAIAQFQAALAAQPGLVSAYVNFANALLKKGDKQTAQDELRQALDLDPTIAVAHIELGLLLAPASGGLTPDARRELEDGLRLEPQLWSALPAPVYEQLVLGN